MQPEMKFLLSALALLAILVWPLVDRWHGRRKRERQRQRRAGGKPWWNDDEIEGDH